MINRKRIEDYAFKEKLSFNEAKRRLGGRTRANDGPALPERGGPVAGTGKPKGGAKT